MLRKRAPKFPSPNELWFLRWINVAKIAAELEMGVDEFVNTVGCYLNNPAWSPPSWWSATRTSRRWASTRPPGVGQNLRALLG